jgi:hypothetical protein
MTAKYFLRLAKRCRSLLAKAVNPEVKEQLRVWVLEFEACAAAAKAQAQTRKAKEDSPLAAQRLDRASRAGGRPGGQQLVNRKRPKIS